MKGIERVHAALYAGLVCIFVASGALFASQFLTSAIFWERFTLAYLGVLVLYTWYLFGLLLVHDVRRREDRGADPLLQRGPATRRGFDPERPRRIWRQADHRDRRRIDERRADT